MDELKAETSDLHERLDKHSKLTRLMDDELSLDDYVMILRGMYGFYKPLEAKLNAVYESSSLLKSLQWRERRRKSAQLYNDITLLEGSNHILPIVECDFLPPVEIESHIPGVLYVLEGASLGGQIIKRQLLKQPSLSPQVTSFFSGYGHDTGTMWQKFKSVINAIGMENPLERDTVIASAQLTFTAIIQWMS